MTECWNRRIMELSLSLAICQTVLSTDIMKTTRHLTFCYIKIFLGACCPSLDMKTIDRGEFIFGWTISWGVIHGFFCALGSTSKFVVCLEVWSILAVFTDNPVYNRRFSRIFPILSHLVNIKCMTAGVTGQWRLGLFLLHRLVIQKCEAIRIVFLKQI
jgi:hypothetical protein